MSLLTWNIFMMPPWVHESPRNGPRAAAIAATLLEESFDIICLQKVFDSSAREIMEASLAARYPYRYGPANDDGCSLNLNSGVWVLSQYPLTDKQEIQFGTCSGVECFSRKGAMMLSGACGPHSFRLVVTHLQGEEGAAFTLRNQKIRDGQIAMIAKYLVAPHKADTDPQDNIPIPFFFCGDFGTPRFKSDASTETKSYGCMLHKLEAVNGEDPRFTLVDDLRVNSLATDDTARRNELDYILVRDPRRRVCVERALRVFQREGWDSSCAHRNDLSYRYAVSARVTFGDVNMQVESASPP
jgi:hypothetical protein